MPSDPAYIETKQIMLGNQVMKPEFRPLAEWIDETYGVKTINIFYETVDAIGRPRIEICFEHSADEAIFYCSEGLNYDSKKQNEIAKKFQENLKEQRLMQPRSLLGCLKKKVKPKYDAENLLVIYGSFESVAKIEANQGIPEFKVTNLKNEFKNTDIWKVSRQFSGTTIFLYTKSKLKSMKTLKNTQSGLTNTSNC